MLALKPSQTHEGGTGVCLVLPILPVECHIQEGYTDFPRIRCYNVCNRDYQQEGKKPVLEVGGENIKLKFALQ